MFQERIFTWLYGIIKVGHKAAGDDDGDDDDDDDDDGDDEASEHSGGGGDLPFIFRRTECACAWTLTWPNADRRLGEQAHLRRQKGKISEHHLGIFVRLVHALYVVMCCLNMCRWKS